MTAARFRLLVVITAVVYVWWATLPPMSDGLSQSMRNVLEGSGTGAVLTPNHWATPWVYNSFYGLLVLAAAGLLLLRSWGRTLLLIHTVFAILLSLFYGVTASAPFDNFLGSLAATLAAVVLGVSYFAPLRAGVQEPAPDDDIAAPEYREVSEATTELRLVPVLETGDATVLEIFKSWLTASSIEYVVENDATPDLFAAGRLGGFNFAIGPSRILVSAQDAEAARLILKDASDEQARAPADNQ